MRRFLAVFFVLSMLSACGGGGSTPAAAGDATTGGATGGTTGGTTTPTVGDSSIQFDLSGAVAILKSDGVSASLSKASSSSVSNVLKLTSSGSLENVFIGAEQVVASTLYIAPDGKLYIALQAAVTIAEKSCVLVRLGLDNVGECVDDNLSQINTFGVPAKPIQFDDAGNIYYSGTSSDGKVLLRKKTSSLSESFDLVNDNISISRFIVKGDGTVYFSGTNTPTSTTFFRRILTSGALENLLNGASIQSLYELPDGNVYAGDWGARFGVMKVTDVGLSDTLYIGGAPYATDNLIDAYCDGNSAQVGDNRWRYWGLCSWSGTMLLNYYRAADDNVYVVVGQGGDSATLWQYWPVVKPIDTSILRPTIVSGVMTTLIIAGYDASSKNKLISYNTGDQSEIDLLGGVDIEIYHFSYSASTGRIIFDGLRFSDNKYIVGSIDTQNGNALTELESGTKYEDMQFFE